MYLYQPETSYFDPMRSIESVEPLADQYEQQQIDHQTYLVEEVKRLHISVQQNETANTDFNGAEHLNVYIEGMLHHILQQWPVVNRQHAHCQQHDEYPQLRGDHD